MGTALEELYKDQGQIITLADDPDKKMPQYDHEIFENAARWIYESGGFKLKMLQEEPAQAVIKETSRVISKAVDYSITQEVPETLTAALRNNAFIFSGFKTYHSLSEVGLSLTDEKGAIRPFDEFFKDARKIDKKYNENDLYAEYNHAVHASQMAVKWHEFEEDGNRYNLQYRTAKDDKVRSDHAALHNITLPVDDPFWNEYLPPNGWNCRCNVVQVRKSKYKTSDSEQAVKLGEKATDFKGNKIFRFNPGKTLEIFPEKHPYYKAPQEVRQIIKEIKTDEFTAKSIPEAEELFRSKFGVNCSLAGFKKKDLEQVKDIFDCVNTHFSQFPELKEKIGFVGSMRGRVEMLTEIRFQELYAIYKGQYLEEKIRRTARSWARKIAHHDCYAYSSSGQSQYGMNGLAYNTAWTGEKIKQSLDKDVNAKFHPIGCNTVKSIFDHELAHKLDELLGLRTNSDFLKIYQPAADKGADYIKENLSAYAYHKNLMSKVNYNSRAEFIAEAWSEYQNNPKPRDLAKKVGELIEKEYKKQKGKP